MAAYLSLPFEGFNIFAFLDIFCTHPFLQAFFLLTVYLLIQRYLQAVKQDEVTVDNVLKSLKTSQLFTESLENCNDWNSNGVKNGYVFWVCKSENVSHLNMAKHDFVAARWHFKKLPKEAFQCFVSVDTWKLWHPAATRGHQKLESQPQDVSPNVQIKQDKIFIKLSTLLHSTRIFERAWTSECDPSSMLLYLEVERNKNWWTVASVRSMIGGCQVKIGTSKNSPFSPDVLLACLNDYFNSFSFKSSLKCSSRSYVSRRNFQRNLPKKEEMVMKSENVKLSNSDGKLFQEKRKRPSVLLPEVKSWTEFKEQFQIDNNASSFMENQKKFLEKLPIMKSYLEKEMITTAKSEKDVMQEKPNEDRDKSLSNAERSETKDEMNFAYSLNNATNDADEAAIFYPPITPEHVETIKSVDVCPQCNKMRFDTLQLSKATPEKEDWESPFFQSEDVLEECNCQVVEKIYKTDEKDQDKTLQFEAASSVKPPYETYTTSEEELLQDLSTYDNIDLIQESLEDVSVLNLSRKVASESLDDLLTQTDRSDVKWAKARGSVVDLAETVPKKRSYWRKLKVPLVAVKQLFSRITPTDAALSDITKTLYDIQTNGEVLFYEDKVKSFMQNISKHLISQKDIDCHAKSSPEKEMKFGWRYYGEESNFSVLQKKDLRGDGLSVSFLARGTVQAAPINVYKILIQPGAQVDYNSQLKKCSLLYEDNLVKIFYTVLEMDAAEHSAIRDFYIIQYENIDRVKYVISQHSIQWPSGPEKVSGITTGKMLPSGWVIEPLVSGNKDELHSLVTRLVQVEFTSESSEEAYILEDMAYTQAILIADLQQFLLETMD